MSVPTVRPPRFPLTALSDGEAPEVMTDSAAERAWVPAYQAQLTSTGTDRTMSVPLARAA